MAKPTPQWQSPTRKTPIRFHFSAPSVSSRSCSSSGSPRNSSTRGSPCSSQLSSPSSSASNSPKHDRRLSIHSTSTTSSASSSTSSSSLSSSARQQQQLFTHIRHKFQQGLHTLEDLQTFLEVTIKTAATATAAAATDNKSSASPRVGSPEASANKQAHRTATAKALKPHQPSVRNLLSNMIIMAKWLVDYLHTVEREGCFSCGGCEQPRQRLDSYPVRSTSLAEGSPYHAKSSTRAGRCADYGPRCGEGGSSCAGGGGGGGGAAARAHAAVVQELRGELHSYSWRVMRITTILKEWL